MSLNLLLLQAAPASFQLVVWNQPIRSGCGSTPQRWSMAVPAEQISRCQKSLFLTNCLDYLLSQDRWRCKSWKLTGNAMLSSPPQVVLRVSTAPCVLRCAAARMAPTVTTSAASAPAGRASLGRAVSSVSADTKSQIRTGLFQVFLGLN